ncbi:MAG: NAD-dependent epimerase/dehydratase family protein [Bryobacteraceae bacterium]|nr:NAD-dependent epimerase/dehydratase family protein [Bryobacteraceae bacterium]
MIGSNLVKRLAAMECRVAVVDNLWRGKIDYLYEHGRPVIDLDRSFHRIDLSVPGSIDHLVSGFDCVYHLADVVAGISYVLNNSGNVFRQNLLINSNVTASVRNSRRIQGFVYVGTACSYPAHKQTGVDAPPLIEEDVYPAAPETAYGWSKLMGEYESLLMERECGIPVCVPVLHNVYGTPCDFSGDRAQVIPSLARKAARYPDEPFIVWGSGSQGRAFVHVDDVVSGLIAAMEKGLGCGTVQLGPDRCDTIRTIAETLVDISGKDIPIVYDTSRPEGDRGRCANYSKARRLLGWEPRVTLRDGLTSLYKWVEEKVRATAAASQASD